MILPEVRVLLERAAARRSSLDGLLDALPGDYYDRVAQGEAWSIREQVVHLAASEEMLTTLIGEVTHGASRAWVGGTQDLATLLELRARPLHEFAAPGMSELRLLVSSARAGLTSRIAALGAGHLDATVCVAGVVNRWGEPLSWTLREYLATWTAHDPEHEASIRLAMTTPPDLSAVALAQRRRG